MEKILSFVYICYIVCVWRLPFSVLQIPFWDWRNGKQIACLEESHVDDVTQVFFILYFPLWAWFVKTY